MNPHTLITKLNAIYDANAGKIGKLRTISSNGIVIEQEVDCNPIALAALSKLVALTDPCLKSCNKLSVSD